MSASPTSMMPSSDRGAIRERCDDGGVPRPLEVVIRHERTGPGTRPAESDVILTFLHPAATVADLASALDLDVSDTVLIDGTPVARGLPVRATDVRRGSVVTVRGAAMLVGRRHEDGARDTADTGVTAVFRTVRGPDAGGEVSLGPGSYILGRGEDADLRVEDPSVARRHAMLVVGVSGGVEVTDLAPSRPSRVDGRAVGEAAPLAPGQLLEVGASAVQLVETPPEPEGSVPRAARSRRSRPGEWTLALNRPPRSSVPPPLPPVMPPAAAAAIPGATPVGLVAVVATLAASTIVALVVHQPVFLLLGAVGAAGTITTALWQRARQRSTRRSAGHTVRAELARFHADLGAHQAEVARRLRAATTELADAVAWARRGSPSLWARRAGEPEAFTAVVGRGDRVLPPTLTGGLTTVSADAWVLLEAASVLADVPVTVGLGSGAVVGVVGSRRSANALARSLIVQLAVAYGPADLVVAGLGLDQPGWLRWLPHARDSSSGDSLVVDGADVADVVTLLDQNGMPAARHLLLVVGDPALLAARNSAVRRLLAREDRSVAALVIAASTRELPSVCTTVLDVADDGTARVERPGSSDFADRVAMAGATVSTARRVALALAGLHDPEQSAAAATVPGGLTLDALLDASLIDPDRLAAAWTAAGADPPLRTLLAVAVDGPVEIDLVRDGPHALVAGTTGSGKSELLRSLVVGLAMQAGPDQLAFVLVDYKGGAAFDACARLPHVAGLVTDLDERLAERALRSLHAELRRRELILREVGAADLTAYRAQHGRPALARLVVVVDEFATLAADLPDFVTSLVGIAQRGRSLGVHLVLATQRPAGAVSDEIRANTNLRIALRVQDMSDSLDVIGDPAASRLPRRCPGRALVRLGPDEVVPVQVAAVTAPMTTAGGPAIRVREIGAPAPSSESDGAPSLLEALVDTAIKAATIGGAGAAHRPWMPPLPSEIAWEDLPAGAIGLLDDPDRQAQEPWWWDPTAGHLSCIGSVGSGVSTALGSVVLAAASATEPSELHIYVLHAGSALTSLAGLPHVGASIGPGEDERQARLLRRLAATIDERARCTAEGPRPARVLLVVDRLATWRTTVAERLGPELADLLDRILVEGPGVGVVVAGGLDRPGALALAVSGAVGERLVFRLSDPSDAVVAGVRPALVTGLDPGRAVVASRGLAIQIARASDLDTVVGRIALGTRASVDVAPPVLVLPTRVETTDLPAATGAGRPWLVPVGLADRTLGPAVLALHPGDHVVVAGPARAGKSSALALLATQIRSLAPEARLVAIAPRTSRLRFAGVDARLPDASELASALGARDGPVVVLVDDAELVDDPDHLLAALAGGTRGDAHVIAAGRVEALRTAYGHWTQLVRRQRRGVLLRPQGDLDGDVLSALLPRREATPAAPGRGYLIADGTCAMVQLAYAVRRQQEVAD